MTRKISGGLSGQPGFVSTVQISSTSIISTPANQNITLSPTGTGSVVFTKNAELNAQQKLVFRDADSSNGVSFQSPAVVSSDINWTLPNSDGTTNQGLVTNGSGTLSWRTPTIAISTENVDSTTNYLAFTTITSGDISGARVSTTGARFQPSTSNIINPLITGGTGASNTLTLRSTSNATKGRIIIDETTASSTTTTGALTVSGGVGIAGALNVGGNISSGGNLSITGTTSGILAYSFINGATLLPDTDALYVINSTTAFTITLPPNPTTSRTYIFADGGNFATNNITIGRNGRTIENASTDFVLNVSARVQFTYTGTTWRVVL